MDDIKSPNYKKEKPKDLPNIEEEKDSKTNPSEQYDVSHAPTPHVFKVKKSPAKTIIAVILILLLAAISGYLGYMYLQEKDNANNLQQQLNSAQSQTTAESDSSGQQQPQASDFSYSAEVGKFTLTLPNKYVIIKNIDGGFEGGPVTDLEVALNGSQPGIIDSSYSPNKVMSTLKQGSDLSTYINNRNQEFADVNEQNVVTVDGVEAKVYRLGGLFDINRVYFEKGDNFYELESLAPEPQNELSEALTNIIAGFRFNQ